VPASFEIGPDRPGAIPRAGILGGEILSRFRVAFDYRNDSMWLTPAPDWQKRSFLRDRAGFETDDRGQHLEVVHVCPGSPAAATGWKVGERIVAVDGRPVGSAHRSVDWETGAPGTPVELTDGNGRRAQAGAGAGRLLLNRRWHPGQGGGAGGEALGHRVGEGAAVANGHPVRALPVRQAVPRALRGGRQVLERGEGVRARELSANRIRQPASGSEEASATEGTSPQPANLNRAQACEEAV